MFGIAAFVQGKVDPTTTLNAFIIYGNIFAHIRVTEFIVPDTPLEGTETQ